MTVNPPYKLTGSISTPDSGAKVLVVPTNEEAAIANDTYKLAK